MEPRQASPTRGHVRALINRGAYEEAATALGGICAGDHAGPDDWLLLGRLHLRLGAVPEALTALERAEALAPAQAEVANAAAHALSLQGRLDDAHARLERQLTTTPRDVETLVNLGYLAEQLGRDDEALSRYTNALDNGPSSYRPRLNRAGLLARAGRHADALADYDALVEVWSDRAAAWYNRGECLSRLGRFEAAADSCERALAIEPGHVNAMMCRAVALASAGQIDEAQALFLNAWACDRETAARYGHSEDPLRAPPDARAVHVYQAFSRLYLADWHAYPDFVRALERYAASENGPPDDISMAFPAMYALVAPACSAKVHAAISQAFVRTVPRGAAPAIRPRERIRIGYLSSKFRPSASMVATGALYGAHDRARFEIFAYAMNPEDRSPERALAAATTDRFTDISALGDDQAAARIRADGIDILVDLNGYSNEARPGIAARRVAPIQITYIGHMHSLYAPWIDYRITDRVAEPDAPDRPPPEARAFLPPSHYPYDERRRPLVPPPPRRELALPEDAFVFCAFCNVTKIEPTVFAAWMAILTAVDDSVLWMLDPGEAARANLLDEAKRAGIRSSRLVFAPRIPHASHMRRLGRADLFLDTFCHGAHTSALDALHAGLPLLTRRGDSLARRVGASLLTALETPELIATGTDDYVGKAIAMAADRVCLGRLRTHIESRIAQANPFATSRIVARLECAFETMWSRCLNGLSPADFDVP